jgi:V-type H+-transporting ATPase subunit C
MTSIDTVMKSKLNSYNLAKGSLVQMQRKKTFVSPWFSLDPKLKPLFSGNLSVRSLAEVVTSDNFIPESEYLETVLVAVSKSVALALIIDRHCS